MILVAVAVGTGGPPVADRTLFGRSTECYVTRGRSVDRAKERDMARRITVLGYGLVAYAAFVAAIVYAVGFLADAVVPKGIDDGVATPAALAVAIDAGLLGLFAVQHSVMARPWFKRWWTRFVPA